MIMINLNILIVHVFICRNLEVFESHLGNLPFDIHHVLKVKSYNTFTQYQTQVIVILSSLSRNLYVSLTYIFLGD